jgi:hypothetical protein
MAFFGIKFADLWRSGAEQTGTIVGIRVREKGDEDSTERIEEYAVDLGGEVLGIRQNLSPVDEVRLGMPVTVRRDGKHALIAWGSPQPSNWKMLGSPPAAGIDDNRTLSVLKLTGKKAQAEILSIGSRSAMLGLVTVNEVKFRVAPDDGSEPFETTASRVEPAFYAAHLFEVGRVLPAYRRALDPSSVRIDWAAAAMADPGVGVRSPWFADPTAPVTPSSLMAADSAAPPPPAAAVGGLDKLQQKLTALSAKAAGANMDAGPTADDPVTWEMFLAVSRGLKDTPIPPDRYDAFAQTLGVPAGEWAAANARWMGRLMTDWRLGAAYGQAMS